MGELRQERPSRRVVFQAITRRGSSSSDPFTELVVMFLDLPWWASLIGAVVVYLVLGLLVPAISAQGGIGGVVTAGIMRVLGPALAVLILIAGVLGALRRWVDRWVARKRAERRQSQSRRVS